MKLLYLFSKNVKNSLIVYSYKERLLAMFLSVGKREQKKQNDFRWPWKVKSTQNNEELSSLVVQQKKSSHIMCIGSEKF